MDSYGKDHFTKQKSGCKHGVLTHIYNLRTSEADTGGW